MKSVAIKRIETGSMEYIVLRIGKYKFFCMKGVYCVCSISDGRRLVEVVKKRPGERSETTDGCFIHAFTSHDFLNKIKTLLFFLQEGFFF
jgi:hypothetical protein